MMMCQTVSDKFVVLLGDYDGHVGWNANGHEGVHGGFVYKRMIKGSSC